MSRTVTTKTVPAAAPRTLPDDDQRVEAAQDARALAVIEQNQRVTALAQQLNYNGSTNPAVLENSARDAIRRIGMGIFELGAYLLLMKQSCEYGKFLPALERLNISADAAQRYMSVTLRFSNTATSRHLEAIGMSKLVELLPLDDGQLEDLTELGQTGELALDDVVGMSVKELRAAVRKERALSGKQKIKIERLEAVGDELNEEINRFKLLKPDEARAKRHKDAADALSTTLGQVKGNFRAALLALHVDGGEQGANAILMAGMVGQVQAELLALRDEFNLRDIVGDGKPEWERWTEANPVPDASESAPTPTLPRERGREA